MSKSIVGVPVEGQQITIGLPKIEREAVIVIAYNSYVDSKICRRFPIIAMYANHVDNIRRSLAEIRKCQSDSAEKVGSIGIIMLVKSTRGNVPPRGIWQRVGALASASARSDLARVSLSLSLSLRSHKYSNKNTDAILTLPTFSSANPLPPRHCHGSRCLFILQH